MSEFWYFARVWKGFLGNEQTDKKENRVCGDHAQHAASFDSLQKKFSIESNNLASAIGLLLMQPHFGTLRTSFVSRIRYRVRVDRSPINQDVLENVSNEIFLVLPRVLSRVFSGANEALKKRLFSTQHNQVIIIMFNNVMAKQSLQSQTHTLESIRNMREMVKRKKRIRDVRWLSIKIKYFLNGIVWHETRNADIDFAAPCSHWIQRMAFGLDTRYKRFHFAFECEKMNR